MLSIYVGEDEISHGWESVWLMEHVIDESVNLHVVSNVSGTVRNQHVTVRVFDDFEIARKRLGHCLEIPARWKDYCQENTEGLPLGIVLKSTSEGSFT